MKDAMKDWIWNWKWNWEIAVKFYSLISREGLADKLKREGAKINAREW